MNKLRFLLASLFVAAMVAGCDPRPYEGKYCLQPLQPVFYQAVVRIEGGEMSAAFAIRRTTVTHSGKLTKVTRIDAATYDLGGTVKVRTNMRRAKEPPDLVVRCVWHKGASRNHDEIEYRIGGNLTLRLKRCNDWRSPRSTGGTWRAGQPPLSSRHVLGYSPSFAVGFDGGRSQRMTPGWLDQRGAARASRSEPGLRGFSGPNGYVG